MMVRSSLNGGQAARRLGYDEGTAGKYGAACIVLYLYFIFEYIRPQSSLVPFLGYLKIPMFLTLALFIFFLKGNKSILKDRLVRYTGLFVALVAVSVFYAVNNYNAYTAFMGLLIVFAGIILVMPVVCDTGKRLSMFLKVWLIVHAYLAVYSLTHAGRGPGGFLYDENDFALTLNMTLPLPIYLSLLSGISVLTKWALRAVALLMVIAVGATLSRGGFLGMISVFVMLWLLSSNRMARLMKAMLVIAVLGYPVYKMVPQSYIEEMSTITDEGDSTREDRLYFWGLGWDMFLDHPVFGVGANNYPWNVPRYQISRPDFDSDRVRLAGGRPAHSLYFTLLPELGLAGTGLYLLILYHIVAKLRHIMRICNARGDMANYRLLAKAMAASLVTFLVTGAFISVLYYQPFWYLVAFITTFHVFVTREHSRHEKAIQHDDEGAAPDRNGRAGRRRDRSGGNSGPLPGRI